MNDKNQSFEKKYRNKYFDAINTVFALLEKASFAKFRLAFPESEAISSAKATWLSFLKCFTPERIVEATKRAISKADYYPDLIDILKQCRFSLGELGLKPVMLAYKEACLHDSDSNDWSHLAIRMAAEQTGRYTLRTEPEKVTFPMFKRNYLAICSKLQNGETIEALAINYKKNITKTTKNNIELLAQKKQKQLISRQNIDITDPEAARNKLLKDFAE